MTVLLSRSPAGPAWTQDDSADPPGPSPVAAAAAAIVAAALGLAACVAVAAVSWVGAGTPGDLTDVARAGAVAWLLGHGSGVEVGTAQIGLVPLGLTVVLGLVVYATARLAARSVSSGSPVAVGLATATFAACYAAVATAASVLAGTGDVSVSPVRAFAGATAVGAVAGGLGLARGAKLGRLVAGWPEALRAVVRGAAAVVAAMVAAGTLLVSAAMAVDFSAAAMVAASLQAGPVGGSVVTLLGILLLPNAALLGIAYLLGPGFVLGSGTVVAPSGVVLGPVPAVPLLAALPAEGPAPEWAMALVAAPALAGALGAVAALRRHPVHAWDRAVLRGTAAGVLGGALTGLATGLAGGSAGPGRLADVGALVWQCTGVAALAAGLGGVAGAVVLTWWRRRRGAGERSPKGAASA